MSDVASIAKAINPGQLEGHPEANQLPKTRGGKVKHRLAFEEKLFILDPTSPADVTLERLMAFMNLFAFRTTGGIITRAGGGHRDWVALKAPISPEQVARHLLADRLLPVFRPQWVGSRSPSTSKLIIIDVDPDRPPDPILSVDGLKEILAFGYSDFDAFTKDRQAAQERAQHRRPFPDRCSFVEDAFRRLGPDPDDPLQVQKQPTPSGGLHYIACLDRPCFFYQIHDLLIQAGLHHVPGQIEFFPSQNRALRLPFGHVPGQPHDPRAWIRFTEDYLAGRIRRHSLDAMYNRLMTCLPPTPTTVTVRGPLASSERSRQAQPAPISRANLGLPRGRRNEPTTPNLTATLRQSEIDRYLHLVNKGITSFEEAEELFALGIHVPGTRTAALKHLAAHFIWIKHQSAEEAADTLILWAMDPRHQSKDIQADLTDGTEKVKDHIVCMCRWYVRNRKSATPADGPEVDPRARFAPAELVILLPVIQSMPMSERTDQAHFFLNLLAFAKQHGHAQDHGSGWEVAVAINAVVRKWPGCRGKDKYKIRMDRAKDSGLLTMIKEKWQRPGGNGRARTYFLSIPCVDQSDWTISYRDALARLADPKGHLEDVVHPTDTDEAMPRSSANEQPHKSIGTPIPHPHEDPDPRSVHPGGTGGCVGSRPPQRPPQPAPIEEFSHRADEAVPAIPAAVVPGPDKKDARGTGVVMSPEHSPLEGDSTERITDRSLLELPPRIKVFLSKPSGELTHKQRRILQDFISRSRLRGSDIPNEVVVSLKREVETHEAKCTRYEDAIRPCKSPRTRT